MTPGPLLLMAAAGVGAGIVVGPKLPRVWLALMLASAVAALAAAMLVLNHGNGWEYTSQRVIAGERPHLKLDALSAVFLALLGVLAGAGSAYAHGYWSDHDYPASAPRGRMWWSVMVLCLGLVLVAWNGLHFLIAWELFTVAAFFLITLERQRREVRAAGWLYLVASHLGTMCLFAFFAALAAAHHGSWELGAMHDQPRLAPLFWLALVGFGLKAGMFPLHIWLPSAHATAPSHVSAIMSGVTIKLGIYGIIRCAGWLPLPVAAPWVVIGIGAITALLGIAFAFAQNDLKRLLAYCSVENIGIILVGVGAALLAMTHGDAPWGRIALAGALLHVWNHGLFKALLFFGAGSVVHATGTREMSRLGGLWRAMPWTAASFTIGAIAISSLPPLNGFVSEWLIYLGLLDAVNGHSSAAWAAMPAMIMLGLTGALALASFLKTGALIFLGAPRTAPARQAHESGWWMRAPMLLLATACIFIGLAPGVFFPAITHAVGAWRPDWTEAETPSTLAALTRVQLTLALILCAAAALLWRVVHARGLRRAPTWDCGYAAPTARMQYTSGSFAGLGAGWFRWVLQPERLLRRPRGFFPDQALRVETVPDTVLERILAPISRATLWLAGAARQLQHGRLQYYIAYVLVGVTALGALVAFEARS